MRFVTVEHRASGRVWAVPAFTSKPGNGARIALRATESNEVAPRVNLCRACGFETALGTVVIRGVTTETTMQVGQADRVVNDHPAFRVIGGKVAYVEATVVNVCPAHNGAHSKRDDRTILDRLETRALELLDAHAERR